MIEQIKYMYHFFSDSVVHKIEYKKDIGDTTYVIINMLCYNWISSEHEEISLIFEDCIFFKFFESRKINSTVITNALLQEVDNYIVFDFFPLYYSDEKIIENPKSDFIVKSKSIKLIKL